MKKQHLNRSTITSNLQPRIAKLETEIAGLRVQFSRLKGGKPQPIDVIDSLRTCFTPEDVAAHKGMERYGRQWRDSFRDYDLPRRSSEFKHIRKEYTALINQLKGLGCFKSKGAAAEFAHRELSK